MVSICHARENAYIEGYLALTLYVIEQVVYYWKKDHILVSVSVGVLGYLLWDKEVAHILRASCSSSWHHNKYSE